MKMGQIIAAIFFYFLFFAILIFPWFIIISSITSLIPILIVKQIIFIIGFFALFPLAGVLVWCLYKFGNRNVSYDKEKYYENALGYIENKKTGIMRHIEVLKEAGITLNTQNIVHHIDGIKKNNTLKNLYICKNQQEHDWIHKSKRKEVKSNVDVWKERM